eukprot:TRINITY_DN6265_c0_g1_i1.p1 TRINITY_DN6265_c0_g1~~TRINITY_DN6265_c0_g1_i1.p1  ORF type:complete len:371 (+),score=51.20 TRINITY_DN6265_c0_g1_i1:91-1203(+)
MEALDQALFVIYIVVSALSLLGALFIVFSFLLLPSLRKKSIFQMVACMAFADLGLALKFFLPALSGVLGTPDYDPPAAWCDYEGFSGQFFGLSSVSWYFTIALSAFLSLKYPLHFKTSQNIIYLYHLFVWGVSGITTIISWKMAGYGPSGDGTCWIQTKHELYRLLFYVPLLFYMAFTFFLLIYIIRNRTVLSFGSPHNLVSRMIAFVLAFVVVWSVSAALHLYQVIFPSDSDSNFSHVVTGLHAIALAGQGFVNFVVWVSSPAFSAIWQCLPQCCREQEAVSTSSMSKGQPLKTASMNDIPSGGSPAEETAINNNGNPLSQDLEDEDDLDTEPMLNNDAAITAALIHGINNPDIYSHGIAMEPAAYRVI